MENMIREITIFIKRIPCYFGIHGRFSKLLYRDTDTGRDYRQCMRCDGVFSVRQR